MMKIHTLYKSKVSNRPRFDLRLKKTSPEVADKVFGPFALVEFLSIPSETSSLYTNQVVKKIKLKYRKYKPLKFKILFQKLLTMIENS